MKCSSNFARSLNVACLNVEGCKTRRLREIIVRDARNYDLQVLALTETHVGETGIEFYNEGGRKYTLSYCGKQKDSYHGVGLLID